MGEYGKAFVEGCKQGAREAPRVFFAPLVAMFRWLNRVTDEAIWEATPPSYEKGLEIIVQAEHALSKARVEAFDRMEMLDVALWAKVLVVWGNEGQAARWMADPSEVLDQQRPYQVLVAGGRDQVLAALDHIVPE
jgi:hypothetical protein